MKAWVVNLENKIRREKNNNNDDNNNRGSSSREKIVEFEFFRGN